jgi:DNA-binding Lrp family transcriptional regulator
MIDEGLKLDETDISIILLTQKNPNITHSRIAEVVNKSQPTIGARIKKLKKAGVLQFQPGVNFKKANTNLIIVNLRVKNPEIFMEMAKSCPFMLNTFKLSGEYNIVILMTSTSLNKLYNVVNHHFRINSEVQKVSMEIVTEIAKDLILPVNFDSEVINPTLDNGCGGSCEYCKLNKIMEYK